MRFGQVRQDVVDNPVLRAGQLKRQFFDKAADIFIALRQSDGVFRRGKYAQISQAQVVRQQLFKGEPLLAGMRARQHSLTSASGGGRCR